MREELSHQSRCRLRDDGQRSLHRFAVAQHVDVAQHLGGPAGDWSRGSTPVATITMSSPPGRRAATFAVQVQQHAQTRAATRGSIRNSSCPESPFTMLIGRRRRVRRQTGCTFVPPLGGRPWRPSGPRARRRPQLWGLRDDTGRYTNSVSWQGGLTRAVAGLVLNTWSRQVWLQAMVLMRSARPCAAFFIRPHRLQQRAPSDTMSAQPYRPAPARPLQACWMRLTTSGVVMPAAANSAFISARIHANKLRGTLVVTGHPPVPADAGVDDVRPPAATALPRVTISVPRAAAGHQVDHRQAVDDDEVRPHRPRACG